MHGSSSKLSFSSFFNKSSICSLEETDDLLLYLLFSFYDVYSSPQKTRKHFITKRELFHNYWTNKNSFNIWTCHYCLCFSFNNIRILINFTYTTFSMNFFWSSGIVTGHFVALGETYDRDPAPLAWERFSSYCSLSCFSSSWFKYGIPERERERFKSSS